jgi:hypothetical protein
MNPVISGWSFSLRKKVSCKHIMSGICFCLLRDQIYSGPSTRNIKRGGTAIYCKNHLIYTVRNIDTLLEVSAIDIKLNNKLTTLVNIYDTDSKTTQSEYQKIFTQISDQCVVCGDFNAHHKLWGGGGGGGSTYQVQ